MGVQSGRGGRVCAEVVSDSLDAQRGEVSRKAYGDTPHMRQLKPGYAGLTPSIPLSSRAREGDFDRWLGRSPPPGLAGEGARERGIVPHETSEVFEDFESLICVRLPM